MDATAGSGHPLWVMIAGPYTSGGASAEQRASNLQTMNVAAYQVFLKGHIPVIGVNMALPIIEAAGESRFDDVMMPISLALAKRCDACLRIGGPSLGADEEAAVFEQSGKPVFRSIDELPTLQAEVRG